MTTSQSPTTDPQRDPSRARRQTPEGSAKAAGAHPIPLYTLAGVRNADISTHAFSTADGLGLSMLRFVRRPSEDVVVVVHGLTTSSDMFIMPEHRNLVSTLLDEGFEVITVDFRMSNRHPYNLEAHRFNFDDCALFDFPAAIEAVRKVSGDRRIHVICHCLGAVSFLMGLFGGAVTGITSVIANSVGLTPRVPPWSRVKLTVAPFLLEEVLGLPHVAPGFKAAPGLAARLVGVGASLLHRECDVPACHMLSTMWGAGRPALYEHENLHAVTHERGGDLYGGTAVNYYRHVLKMVRAGNRAVKYDETNAKYAALPNDYLADAGDVKTPVLFVTGANNRVFTDSNILCYRTMDEVAPRRHKLHVFPGYGHQDVFMGKNVDVDIFPVFTGFLQSQRRERAIA